MPRIVQTALLGWVDLDHVQRVTPVEWEANAHGGGNYAIHVYMMMRDKPFSVYSEWEADDSHPCPVSMHESLKAFLLQWRDA